MVCTDIVTPIVEVKNNGTIPIAEFDLKYILNGGEQIYTYDGDTLHSGELVDLQLNQTSLGMGSHKLEVSLENIPGDVNVANNKMNHVFAVDEQDDFIPLREQFESGPVCGTTGA